MNAELIKKGSSQSTTLISFENLLSIFPIGVTSKNKLMGELRTLFIISEWSHFEICNELIKNSVNLAKTVIAFIPASPNINPEKYGRSPYQLSDSVHFPSRQSDPITENKYAAAITMKAGISLSPPSFLRQSKYVLLSISIISSYSSSIIFPLF